MNNVTCTNGNALTAGRKTGVIGFPRFLAAALLTGLVAGSAFAANPPPPEKLTIAVVQLAERPTLAATRDRMVEFVGEAARRGARVVVFPEGALDFPLTSTDAGREAVIAPLRTAARQGSIYILSGMTGPHPGESKPVNSMFVIGPDGADIFGYTKLYNVNRAKMPGVFRIDGIACNAMICADRWLRGIEEIPIQEGAQISFELSGNLAVEWVPPYEWYWYVPRALRNNVWVVFSNTANPAGESTGPKQRHGHGAIIAPDGRLVAASRYDTEGITVGEIDVAEATRFAAKARAMHPVLRSFWEAGVTLQRGGTVTAPALASLKSPELDVTLAVAQVHGDLPAMVTSIREARARQADVVAFPAGSVRESDLPALQAAAKAGQIVVVVGATHRDGTATYNSAFVIGPDGALLTRYDQLSAAAPFSVGIKPETMWFSIKGVPAIVTIGRDALWTELAELAAVAGARVIVHLDHDPGDTAADRLRRLQVWSNHASFLTFTAAANVVDSMIWDDLRGMEEISAEYKGRPRPDSGPVQVFSPWSANLVSRAEAGTSLLIATRRIRGASNPHHPNQTTRYNPQMDAWYRVGAALIRPQ